MPVLSALLTGLEGTLCCTQIVVTEALVSGMGVRGRRRLWLRSVLDCITGWVFKTPSAVGQLSKLSPVCLLFLHVQEHEQAVIEQHIKREAELAAAEQEKRARTAAAAWRRLLNRMWTKIELQHKYGTTGATDAAAAGGGVAAAGAAAALGPSGDGRHLKEVIGSLNAAAGGSSFLQQQDSAVPTAAAVATAAAAGAGDRQPGSSAAAADGTVPVTVDAAEASGSGVAGQLSAAAAGQQAARAGGGTAGVRRSNRPLPPGVAPTGQPLLADAAWQAAAAAGESAAAGQSVDGGQEQEQGAAQQLGLYALDGVEVEEF